MDKIVDGKCHTTEMPVVTIAMYYGENYLETRKDDSGRRCVFVFSNNEQLRDIRHKIKMGIPIPIDDAVRFFEIIRKFHTAVHTTMTETEPEKQPDDKKEA